MLGACGACEGDWAPWVHWGPEGDAPWCHCTCDELGQVVCAWDEQGPALDAGVPDDDDAGVDEG